MPGLELRSDTATGEELEVIVVQAGRCAVRCLHWVSGRPSGIENDQLRYSVDDTKVLQCLRLASFEVSSITRATTARRASGIRRTASSKTSRADAGQALPSVLSGAKATPAREVDIGDFFRQTRLKKPRRNSEQQTWQAS
jgi:hypothetical protein